MGTGIPEQEADAAAGHRAAPARVCLCGPVAVELDGRRVEDRLPGRQGRLMLAYLVVNRGRPVSRDELVGLLWPEDPPASPEASLRPLLTRMRRALGDARVAGRGQITLDLGPGAWVDVEIATTAATRAEELLEAGRATEAHQTAREALAIVGRPFLPDALAPWAEERRGTLRDLEPPLLEAAARAALAMGPGHRAEAEQLARRLVEREPYRESGHAILMQVLARQDNVVEALRVFDALRIRLRDDLGLTPAPGIMALHDRLLRHDEASAGAPQVPVPRPARAPDLPAELASAAGGAFVGRSGPMGALEAAWGRAMQGTEQLAFVAGESGVGKTRLVAQLASQLHSSGATVLYGRCDEEALMPYQPVAEALRHAVRGGAPVDLPPEQAGELARLVPELSVLGATNPAEPAPADQRETMFGERDTQRYRLFEAVASALAALAAERGLLLVVDDLHWADRTTLLLLRFLARAGGSSPILLLATYRDDGVGRDHPLADLLADVRRDRRSERVALAGLGEPETAALVAVRLPAGASEAFVRRLQTQTSGNPFFIEEMLRALGSDDGGMDEEKLLSAAVPEGVGDVIMRRLGTVGEDVTQVLAVAAVAGREFELDVVAAALRRPEEDVLSALERAMDARLVVEAPGQVDRFSFCHALVRRTLYDGQALSRRLRRHLAVAEALERPDRVRRPAAAELARHYVTAAELAGPERVLEHVLAAADEASAKLAYEEAAAHLMRALELLEPMEDAQADARRCATLLALGRVLWRAGDPSARARFAQAAEIARRAALPEPLGRAVLGMTGRFYDAAVADPGTIRVLDEALQALGEGDSSLRARLLARLSDSLHVVADEERRSDVSAEAVAMARRLGDEDALNAALMARHAALLHVGHLDERLEIAREQLELARRRGRPEALAVGLHWRIYDLLERGDGQAARRDEAELAAVAADLRQPLYRYLDRCWQAVWAQMEGRLDDADAISADAFALGRRAGARTAGSTRLATLFAIRRDQGRAGELVDEIRAIVAEHPQITAWRGSLPLVLVEAGLPDEARAALDGLEADGFDRLPRDLFWIMTVLVMGEAAVDAGSDAQREALYALLAPHADRCAPASLAACWGSVARVVGRLALSLGREDDAEHRLDAALVANERLGAVAAAVRTRRDLAGALARRGDARADDLLDTARRQARDLGLDGLVD